MSESSTRGHGRLPRLRWRLAVPRPHRRPGLRPPDSDGGVQAAAGRVRYEGVGAHALGCGERRRLLQRELRHSRVLQLGLPVQSLNLSPPELKEKIEYWNWIVYPAVNNGVYRCGFAQTREAYEVAVNELFNTLEMLEEHLGICRYLCGVALTLADVCLFTTLVRFDLVYHGLFKCSKEKLIEYPNLHAYTRDIYQIPNAAESAILKL